ncbi:MAG: S16 family serine protease [Fusobacteriaceae bacterium]
MGEMTMSGEVLKAEELANILQVCKDVGAKKILIPVSNIPDLATLPPTLLSEFQPIFYINPVDAVQKALGFN